jgi:Na+/H+ antiporter NhaD/arsenite permease-like protein
VFTLIGALAGILWVNIMALHGLTCSYARFARVCCPVGAAAMVAALLALWFEFALFPGALA